MSDDVVRLRIRQQPSICAGKESDVPNVEAWMPDSLRSRFALAPKSRMTTFI
jgi:hypothetical protein